MNVRKWDDSNKYPQTNNAALPKRQRNEHGTFSAHTRRMEASET
jgi:hypothetical protein